ncbi:MAG: hypothetical protein ABI728_00885 [Betaproteobacteria bacterium]
MAPLTEKGLSDWRVETLRLTIFPTAMPDVAGIDWWEAVVGESPESKTLQPRVGMLQEIGQIKGGLCNLSLECQPQRIDWLFSPILKEKQELTEFPTFANLVDGHKLFQAMLLPWLSRSPGANRIAFGAVLAYPVESRKAGYELLGKYLPSVRLDPENSRDFSFQINRPRTSASGIANVQINRLSRWSVARLSGMVIQFTGGQPTTQVFESSKGLDACRVELDINTSPQFEGTLPPDKIEVLVRELVDLGIEIANKGDMP